MEKTMLKTTNARASQESSSSSPSQKRENYGVIDQINLANTVGDLSTNSAGDHLSTSRSKRCFNTLKLELVTFIFTLSYTLPKISSSSMIVDKVCLAHFQYSKEICDNLQNYTTLKTEIVKVSTNYQLGHTLIQTAPAAILSCFLGPWSDNYGRKLPAIIAMLGMIVDASGSTVNAYFLSSRVEYYFIPAILTGLCGGVVTNLAVIYSFVFDTTDATTRTMKFGKIEMATAFSASLGSLAGGWIYDNFGYPAVFVTSAVGLLFSFLGLLFLLPETRGLDNKDSWGTKLRNLFSLETFKASFIATTKNRPHKGRKQILLLLFSMCFIVIALNATTDINYLFVHNQFSWDAAKYSYITAIYSVIAIVELVLVIPAMYYFKTKDPTLGLIGSMSLFVKFVGIGLSWKSSTIFHIASVLGLLYPCASMAVRSRISKLVTKDDVAKVFSFVATGEALLPILTTVLFSQIFTASLDFYPGMPYAIIAVLLSIPLSVFAWMICLPVSTEKTETTESEIPHASLDNA